MKTKYEIISLVVCRDCGSDCQVKNVLITENPCTKYAYYLCKKCLDKRMEWEVDNEGV